MRIVTLPKIIIFILILFITSVFMYQKRIDKYKHKLHICSKTTKTILKQKYISFERLESLDQLDETNLQMGMNEMLKHKIIIVGITRDNDIDFPYMVRHIEHIGASFKDYRVVMIENDSTDGTKENLELWKLDNPKVELLLQDFDNEKRPNHQFLADIRNEYLNFIEKKEYEGFDVLMVLDMDMRNGVDIRGIEDSFSKINQWDAVCSNGVLSEKMHMYDAFAFRDDEFPWAPYQWENICKDQNRSDEWAEKCKKGMLNFNGDFSDLKGMWLEKDKLYWKLIVPQIQKIYPANHPLTPVQSCFGGMAIYKIDFIKGCTYNSIDNDCEHVPFHQCIRDKNNARMIMNPNQLIRYD